MLLFRVTWPITLAVWGCVLPALFLTKIDDYLRNHTAAAVVRIYGQSALLYLPFIALAIVLALMLATVFRAFSTRGRAWSELLATVSLALARLLVVGSMIYCANTWLHDVHPGLQIPAFFKLAIAVCALVGSFLIGGRASRPDGFLAVFRFSTAVTLAAVIFAVMTTMLSSVAAVPSTEALKAGDLVEANPRPADIVLITVDALSAEHTSVYSLGRDTTPRLRELATQAVVYDHFYANGNWTQVGISSLLSGRRPWTTNADNMDAGPERSAMAGNLLETAHRAGYSVLTVTTNYNAAPRHQKVQAWVNDARYPPPGDARFFFHYLVETKLGFSGESADQVLFQRILRMVSQAQWDRFFNGGPNRHFDPEPAVEAAKQLWQQHEGSPRFLWIHLMPPHGPYAAPSPFLGRFAAGTSGHDSYQTSSTESDPLVWFGLTGQQALLNVLSDRYDEAALYADHYVGTLLDWLRSRQEFNPALIIVTSDHGENFHHEYGNHGGPMLYEEVIHVPLLIKTPGQVEGRRQEVIAEQVDLAPTLARLLSVEAPEPPYEGKVLSLAREDDSAAVGPPAFAMSLNENPDPARLSTGSVAMIEGPYKLVHYFGNLSYAQMPELHDELYNLSSDAAENENLAAAQPEIRDKMLSEVQRAIASHGRGPHVE